LQRIATLLGASPTLLPYCTAYLKVFSFGICAVMPQVFFEYFIRLDGKPMWAFFITLASGVTNVGLDYYFIVKCGMGVQGAGIASSAGIGVAILIGGYYFIFRAKRLKPVWPTMDIGFLGRAMVNGSSELATGISSGIKMLVFNLLMIRYAGEAGVAAMAILVNLYFLFSSFHMGLSMGVAPVFSFNFGKKNFSKIRHLGAQALATTLLVSLSVFALAKWNSSSIISLFTKDPHIVALTVKGMEIFAFVYLLNGCTILASSFFTAVGNGKISAIISVFNSFVFTLGFVIVLPWFFDLTGIWLSLPLAEATGLILSGYFIFKYRHVYICPQGAGFPLVAHWKESANLERLNM
jgi:Na+-driven multidrug efflux pump